MSLKNNSVIAKGNESHVCSAQSDSIGSLQFDKRVKIRSYSSQYTISDQIIVGIDRREEFRPIENNAVVEIDLSVGLCSNDRSVIENKYQKIYRLDDMASTNVWLNKMITYDGYVDKDIMTSIRDEAMEPNKLYLLKHKHEEKTSGNYFENPTKNKLRTTAAQFNPREYSTNNNISSIDKIVPPPLDNKSLNVYLKSKNVLRNELIIRTGDFINPPISNDHDKYSTSLSVDLTTHKIPQIVSIEDITDLNDEDSFIKQSIENENSQEPNFEKLLLENDRKSLDIEDIPFAEELETNENDQVDSKRNTLSKSMQYYLPVFESSTNNEENEENLNLDNCSNYSRENVTTDDNESVDQTDKATLLDEEDCESLNAEEFDESLTEHKNSNEIENYSLSSERNSYCLDRSFDPDDIICQENLVMHIHQDTNNNFVNSNDLPKLEKLISETKVPFSQFDLTEEKEHDAPISTLYRRESYKSRSLSFPKDFIEQRKEHEEKTESLINGIYIFNEKEIEPIEEFQTSSEFPNQFNEDENVFIKTKSFSLKRNSGKFAEYPNDEDIRPLICPNRDDIIFRFYPVYYKLNSTSSEPPLKQTENPEKTTPKTNLYIDRKEKFLNSNFNSSIQFFQQVSDEHKSPVDTRSSSPSSDTENESNKKSDASTKSSDGSMIIKDVSSDDAYEFPKRPNKTTYEILEEDEDVNEKENSDDDSNNDLSNIRTSTEEIPEKSRSISSTEDLSQYSSSTTVTVNEIILTDLVKTPIDSTPGHFEKFLRERELRLSKDKMSTDENSSFGEEIIEHAVFVKKIHAENDETQLEENKMESSYTEDTSSSSSDYSENIIPAVLRQGESMEDIEKYLYYSNKENVSLKRSSGFEEQLNIAFNQENNDENLLYKKDIDNRHFSTSSDDNVSLDINKRKPIEITKKPETISKESLPNEKPLTKKFEDYSSSETISSDSELSEISIPQEKPVKQSCVKVPGGKINKQMSMPTLHKDLSESLSDSGSTQSISTSTDNTAPKTNKILKPSKFIERGEKFANNKQMQKQISLPASKNHLFEKESSNESDDSSRSVSTSEDEIHPTNIKYTDRTENQQTYNPKNKQISIPISKKILSNLSKSSESSQSFSTSEEDIPLRNDKKSIESKFIDKEEKFHSNQSINKKIFTKQSKRLSRSSNSRTNSGRSISTSSNESQHSYVNLKNSKFIDKEEKFPSSQSFNKEIIKPKFKKQVPKSGKSSSSQSVSTSSDEELPANLKESKFIDKEEKFPSSQSFNKEIIKPKSKKEVPKSGKSSSSQSVSTSSDEELPVNLKDSKFIDKEEKFPSSQSFNKEIIKPKFKKQISKSSKSSSSQSESTSSDEEHQVNLKESKFIEKEEKFPSSQSFNKEIIKPKSKKVPKSGKRSSSQSVSTSSDEELPDQSYLSSTSSDEEPPPIPVKKESSANVGNKNSQNIFIDRREKFTEFNSSSKTSNFKRSSSVPNYFKDSNNFSSMDEDSHLEKEKLSQSLKSINADPSKNNLGKNEQNRSYELLRVELKDYSKKNSSLSIDRREKFCSGEELDRITPCEILKDENPLENSRPSVSSLSDSSESVATSTRLSETKLSKHEKIEMEDFLSDDNISSFDDSYCQDDKLNYTRNLIDTLSPITKEYLNEIVKPHENTEITNIQDDIEKEIVICVENNFDQNEIIDNKDENNSISCSITSTESSDDEKEKERDFKFIERNEKFPDENNVNKKLKHFKSKNENPMENSKDSISSLSDSSESIATSTGISENKSSKHENQIQNRNEIDHLERFNPNQNSEHQISKKQTKDKPNKSIEHREKFAENKLGNNIKKKQKKNDEDDSTTSSASSTATKSFENLEKLLDKNENEKEEKFANQYNKHLLYEKSKDKSDSTDEDVSLSLTSYPKDNHEFNKHEDSIHSEGKDIEIIVVEITNPESKIRRESPSISMSTSTSISHEKYIKNKYEKNDRFVTRSSQTLPYNKIQMIPIKQKSKSLDKPFFNNSFPSLSQSVPGSLGSIVERRHHEFTETWSKRVPSDSNEFKQTKTKTVIDDEHISTVKNTEIFMKRKFALPLTTRPRPFPSYLSPVNAFPYVPSDPEFSSEDSLANDYSSDNNADEIVTRFKSLPDFVKSLSTTSLPKEPINPTTETIKKPLQKKKSPVTTIDLNYGAVENKNINRSKFKKKNSITSFTTDSSYLDKPILKEKQVITNYASSDSLSSMTVQSSTSNQRQLKPNPKANSNNNNKLTYDSVSSTESSSDSDTRISSPPIGKTSLNNKIQKPLPKNINGKQEYTRKTASLPQKHIPSTSESSEFSSSSDDSAEIFHF